MGFVCRLLERSNVPGGRPAKGPRIHFHAADDEQLRALDQAAAEDEVDRAEMIRRLIAYGLTMREKTRAED